MPVTSRLAQERGSFLIEFLVAISMGMILLFAAFTLLETTLTQTGSVRDRVDATQRGRLAMDTITRQLRSQVCLDSKTAAVTEATPDRVSFYVDLTDGSSATAPPALHTLTFDPAARTIAELAYTGTRNASGVVSYSSTPTRRTFLSDVQRDGSTPVFSYFAFDAPAPPATPTPTLALAATPRLSDGDRERVARIAVSFDALPSRAKAATPNSLVLRDDVFVRSADPDNAAPTPTCA